MKKTKKKNTATMMFDNSIIDKKHRTSDLVCFTDGSGDNMDLSLPIHFSFVVFMQLPEYQIIKKPKKPLLNIVAFSI